MSYAYSKTRFQPNRSIIGILVGAQIVAVFLAATLSGCCTSEGCHSGFSLVATMEDGEAIPEGELTIYAEIEDDEIQLVCDPACGVPAGAPDNLMLEVETSSTELRFSAHYDEEAEYDHGGSMRGPESVFLRIEVDGVLLGEADFSPTYERDKEYWGSEKCGYCDLQVEETMLLSVP